MTAFSSGACSILGYLDAYVAYTIFYGAWIMSASLAAAITRLTKRRDGEGSSTIYLLVLLPISKIFVDWPTYVHSGAEALIAFVALEAWWGTLKRSPAPEA